MFNLLAILFFTILSYYGYGDCVYRINIRDTEKLDEYSFVINNILQDIELNQAYINRIYKYRIGSRDVMSPLVSVISENSYYLYRIFLNNTLIIRGNANKYGAGVFSIYI